MSDISPAPSDMYVQFEGAGGRLFKLVAGASFLTVLTLGIYRFWMKTRLRRYYWAAIQPGGIPLEYTGTGLEKLRGFLIAVVILAAYLGIFNLALSFVGLAFFQGNPLALNLSFLALLPLIYYARYRSRGYILSRTRWRGLRFGMEKGAGQYTLQAMGHLLLTLITLGVLFPRQVFKMEKFVTDRTWYGTLRMRQEGRWTMNLKPWLLVLLLLALTAAAYAALIVSSISAVERGQVASGIGFLVFLIVAGYLLAGFAWVYYSVVTFRNLAGHKVLGESIHFTSKIRTGKLIGIYILGGLATGLAAMLASFAIIMLLTLAMLSAGLESPDFANMGDGAAPTGAQQYLALAIFILAYLFILLLTGAMAQVFIFQPVLRHYATEMTVHNAHEFETARQRPHDSSVDAGGFADALDVGAAI